MEKAIDEAADKAETSGEALLSLQEPSTDMTAVRSQLRALNKRVSELKVKMARFEEHYDGHLKKAVEFQQAVERLVEKFALRRDKLLSQDIDTTDEDAVKARLEELEVNPFPSLCPNKNVVDTES